MVVASAETSAPARGELLGGRYRVESVLGHGGMGFVVAALDETTGDAVAVKIVRSLDNPSTIDRFFREARAMASLATPHAVRVRDVGSIEGRVPFLVMDRLLGTNLAEMVKTERPALVDVANWTIETCEGLSHAHVKGIVHRDIKPSNLFLHRDEGAEHAVLKVLDFGISKVSTNGAGEHTLTASGDGALLGSPPYMSPEQTRDPSGVDARTDVYSLGVVMYKLLSGRVPFDGRSVGEIFARILEKPYPSLVADGVPAGLDAIVARCMAKDRRERFAHVGELATALAAFASPEHARLARETAARISLDGVPQAPSSQSPLDEVHTLTLPEGLPQDAEASRVESLPPPAGHRPATRRRRAAVVLSSLGAVIIVGIAARAVVGRMRESASPAAALSPLPQVTAATAPPLPAIAAAPAAPAMVVPPSAPASSTSAPRAVAAPARRQPASAPRRASAPGALAPAVAPPAPPPPSADAPATTAPAKPELHPSPYREP